MILFWFCIDVMLLIAIAFVVIPLMRSKTIIAGDADNLAASLYQEQLFLLKEKLGAKELSEQEYRDELAQQQRALLDNVSKYNAKLNYKKSYLLAILLLVLIPVAAITLYLKIGASQLLAQQYQIEKNAARVNQEFKQMGTVPQIIAKLKENLLQNPNSAQGWFLLGRLYLSTHEFSDSAQAFAKANQLQPNDPKILSSYAEALFFANHQQLNTYAQTLLTKALTVQPNNPDAINLLAINAYNQKHYQQAIQYWEKLLPLFSPDSDDGKALLGMIAKAQQGLSQSKISAPAAIRLEITVQLAKNLKKLIKPNDSLFIYAQAVNGPPMPLAVIRKGINDFPATATLTEQMAMIPTATLADFKQVKVFARITSSGQALPQKGDLQGESSIINVTKGTTQIAITINSILH